LAEIWMNSALLVTVALVVSGNVPLMEAFQG
jgi:hypothetical protein